jgi:response regulator RpfG family c-di-GMP phosphodiesterase
VRILVVDDDPALRILLRTTLSGDEFDVEEASSVEGASELARFWKPTIVVLDVGLPGLSGLAWCRELKQNGSSDSPTVILLTGAETSAEEARLAGADALLRKPFSPLDLVDLIDRHAASKPLSAEDAERVGSDQLLVYARDLSRLLQVERAHRRMLHVAYRQTVTAFTDALEAKDSTTGMHSLRVQRYALELTEAVARPLLDDPSLEFGYLLHDVGKMAIPEQILKKPGPLEPHELRLMQQHPQRGVEILHDITLLQGEGLRVVRSHHERWDGGGYPDGLKQEEIPLGARIFAVADALDAMTSDRPYRSRRSWDDAVEELLAGDGSQFDPVVITAFAVCEPRLRAINQELAAV